MVFELSIAAVVSLAFATGCFLLMMYVLKRRMVPILMNQRSLATQMAVLSEYMAALTRAKVLSIAWSSGLNDTTIADVRSQHGEEYLLWALSGMRPNGVYVEVGAHDGVSFSNSYFFEKIGWTGVLVEAHPELAKRCRESRSRSIVFDVALGKNPDEEVNFSMVSGPGGMDTLSFFNSTDEHRKRIERRGGTVTTVTVKATTLDNVLRSAKIDSVDWLSIDVEGGELPVLDGCDFYKIRPRVIMIEDNSYGGNQQLADRMLSFGYRFVCRCECNAFYIPNETQ